MSIRDTPEHYIDENVAYLLGSLKGDGTVHLYPKNYDYRIVLRVTDRDFAVAFFNALKRIGLNAKISEFSQDSDFNGRKWTTKYVKAQASSKKFAEWYHRLSREDLFHFLATNKMRRAFIRGFYDAEGNLHRYKNRRDSWSLSIWNKNKELIDLVFTLLEIEGIEASKPTRPDLYGIRINRKHMIDKFLLLVKPSIARKRERS